MGGYSHCIEIGQYGMEFPLYLLSLFSGCKSALRAIRLFFLSPPIFSSPLKCRQKGCLDTSIQNKSYKNAMKRK